MRINVYAEEIFGKTDEHGSRVSLIEKQVLPEGPPHKAIRIFIGPRIIHSDNSAGVDDDTSAVSFFYYSSYERDLLVEIFEAALTELKGPSADGA